MAKDAAYQRLAMRAFADFSGTIAIPAVLAALLGKWLDERFQTKPWILLVSLAVAFALTSVLILKKAKLYGRLYSNLDENDSSEDHR